MKRKTCFILLTVLLMMVLFSCAALAESSGTCGENLTWTLDDNGVLTITGTGDMSDYTDAWDPPWDIRTVKQVKIGFGVTSIGNHAFDLCGYLTSVSIPNSVISIGDYAFRSCSMTSAEIPNSVTSIGDGAFYGCDSLTSMNIPNSVTNIGSSLFMGCFSLSSVTISNNLTSISSSVFNSCRSLTSVTIPNSVIDIFGGAFAGCSSLTSVTIPNSVVYIGTGAFQDCSSLTSITIPNSVYSIGASAFLWCSSLTDVVIQDGVTEIDRGAFKGCGSLTNVTIPKSVTSIGDSVFADCSDDLTIYCYSGSTAHQYAKDNNINFSLLDSPEQSWNEPTYTWSNDNSKVTARRVAKDDSSVVEEETVNTTNSVTKQPSRETYNGKTHIIYGERTYVAVFSNPAFSKQEKTVEAKDLYMTDSDKDGLLDFWEMFGFDYDGDGIVDVDLKRMGADKNIPDLFVEIDYMWKPTITYKKIMGISLPIPIPEKIFKPNPEALKLVCAEFAKSRPDFKKGIQLHIDAGPDSIMNSKGDKWGDLSRSTVIPFENVLYLGLDDVFEEWMNKLEKKDIEGNKTFENARREIFRHCLYVNRYQYKYYDTWSNSYVFSTTGSSGIANSIPGQYFIVADVDGWILSSIISEAGTFMHEFGHTIGLRHGGDDNLIYKPNYLSIMNYLYQTRGLYYGKKTNPQIDYSDYILNGLDMTSIDESKGLDSEGVTKNTGLYGIWREASNQYDDIISNEPISKASIDFNNNSIIEKKSHYSFYIQGIGANTIINKSVNDWRIIKTTVFNGNPFGAKGIEGDTDSQNELSYDEAEKMDLLGYPGDLSIKSVAPITLYSNTSGQFVYVEIKNLYSKPTIARLSINSDILSTPYTSELLFEANEVKKLSIPIKDDLEVGGYSFECELINENGKEVFNAEVITVFEATTLNMFVGETKEFFDENTENLKLISEDSEIVSFIGTKATAKALGTVFIQVLDEDDKLLARIPVEVVPPQDDLYFIYSGEGLVHNKDSNVEETFVVKRSINDELTFGLFKEIQIDGIQVDQSNYTVESGSIIIKFHSDFLDTLSVGTHILKAIFEDGFVDINFSIYSNRFEDIAVPSDSFTFKKVWQGDSEKSIDFTLYKADGMVYHHGFDKKVVSDREWKYNAWFSSPAVCYVIEKPIPGYQTKYVNVGVYAHVTDRCCDGGTIINKKLPRTGDESNPALWAGLMLVGIAGLTTLVLVKKRRKAEK